MNKKFLLIIILALFWRYQSVAQPIGKTKTSEFFITSTIGFGPSVLAEKAPTELGPEFTKYFNDVRKGWNLSTDLNFFFNPYLGVGFSYDRFSSKVKADSLIVELFSTKFAFDISNSMVVHSIAPQFYGRLPFGNSRVAAIVNAGPSMLFYRNLGKNVGDSAMFKGSSPGLKVGAKLHYMISNSVGLNLEAQFIYAFLRELTKDNGESVEVIELDKDNYQDISRYNFTAGVFYKIRIRK